MSDQAEFLKHLVKRARLQPAPEGFEESYRILVSEQELEEIGEIAYRIERLDK
jgi:hypothetical protein